MKTVGERLKELRQEKNLSQQTVADFLGIDRSNYSKYELNKLETNNEMLIKLSRYYGVSTDYLLGIKDY